MDHKKRRISLNPDSLEAYIIKLLDEYLEQSESDERDAADVSRTAPDNPNNAED